MKRFTKFLPALLACVMLFSLVGCGSRSGAIDNEPEAPITSTPENTESSSQESSTAQADSEQSGEPSEEPSSAKSLVVYFSWSGNGQQMAQWIADETGGDIYRVTPAEAYATDYEACADRAKNELDNGIRPGLSNLMDAELMAQYDTIYVGFPIWWYDLPMSMMAFLENYDLSGKTIIPFFSHRGSSSGANSLDTLTQICPDSTVRTTDALSISDDNVETSETQVREWVRNMK